MYIGGGDPKDTNHTPLRTMTFSFRAKSFQQKEDSQKELQMMQKISGPTGTPEMVKYITKANINTINERGTDDLTGASYVSDVAPNMTVGQAMCVAATAVSSTYVGPIAGPSGTAVVNYYVNKVCAPAGQYVDHVVDYLQQDHAGEHQGDPMEHGSMGIEEPANDQAVGTPTNNDTDTTSSSDNDNDNGNDGDSEEGGLWDTFLSLFSTDDDQEADGSAGDDGNPNPYEDGSQGATSKPTIGPAPGDIGGRYNNMFNPGAERGFTPGDDGGDGNPGNPWDRNERMSTPSDNGDPIDPLTGFGGPSGPQVDDGNPIDPDEDFDSSGPGDDLWKPNPDDIWGGGPTSKIVDFIQIEDDKSMAKLVNAMSSDFAIF